MQIPIIEKHLHKNSKMKFYINGLVKYLMPKPIAKMQLNAILSAQKTFDSKQINDRLNYYNKLTDTDFPQQNFIYLKDFKYILKRKERGYASSYFFDLHETLRFFDGSLKIFFDFGDVNYIEKVPSIVKSRPISADNTNNIILNLDKSRHFVFVKDKIPFSKKLNKLIGRAGVYQTHRIKFYEQYFNNTLCDLGQVNKEGGHKQWIKKIIGIDQHLKYKFILCLEGNDVATNLKWVMSSNSLAVMPKPKFETWFMEGKLEGGIHYVEISDDYSDLEKQLNYYIHHQDKALQIIDNAHKWVEQFQNKKIENLLSVLVLQKYFTATKQMQGDK